MNRRRLLILGTVVGLGIAGAAFVLPRFLDVDRYRPWLVEEVNRSIHGKFELGHLDLTLWGRLAVRADGAQLKDARGEVIAKIPQVEVTWPWSSVFSGRPELSLRVRDPEIRLVRTKDGQWNVLSVIQSAPVDAAAAAPNTPPAANGAVAVPALVLKSKLNLEISDARIQLNDALTSTVLQLPNLDFKLKDVSLTRPFGWEIGGRVQYALAEGSFSGRGTLAPTLDAGEIKSLALDATLDATGLTLRPQKGFLKTAGQPLLLTARGNWSPAAIVVESAQLTAGKWKLGAKGRVDAAPADHVALSLSASDLEIAQLNEWMKELPELGGKLSLQVTLSGKPSALQMDADVAGQALQAQLPQFKSERPQVDLNVHATLDRVDLKKVHVRLNKDVALQVTGSVSGLRKAPDLLRAQLAVQGGKLDLDRLGLLSASEKADAKGAVAPPPSVSGKPGATGAKSASTDAQWMVFARSPWMQKAEFALSVALDAIVAQGVTLSDFKTQVSAKRGKLDLSQLSFGVFEGKVQSHAVLGTEGNHPTLSIGGQVQNLDLKKAAESQWALFKNTLEGRLELRVDGKSPTLESTALLRALEMRGGFRVGNARFATVDISKLVVDKVNQSIAGAAAKVPALQGKRLQELPEKVAFYESVTSDFTLAGGKVSSPLFLAKPQANAGLEISGPYTVDVISQALQADWTVSDPYNVTQAAGLSVNIAGQDVPHILAESGKPFQIPLQVGCTLTGPCVSQEKIVEHFARVAGANLAKAAGEALRKQAGEQLKRLIPGDAIKKFW